MARVILITGGCRSGKSDFAQTLAESLPGRRVYVATAPVIDAEMVERVRRHQAARGADWHTVEEPVALAKVLGGEDVRGHDVVLVDCLTLWVNNLMYVAQQTGRDVSEDDVTGEAEQVVAASRALDGATVIFVTNEVGLGVVPDNPLARRYRDLVGRCNQTMAAAADVVTLVTCGIPLNLKGSLQ